MCPISLGSIPPLNSYLTAPGAGGAQPGTWDSSSLPITVPHTSSFNSSPILSFASWKWPPPSRPTDTLKFPRCTCSHLSPALPCYLHPAPQLEQPERIPHLPLQILASLAQSMKPTMLPLSSLYLPPSPHTTSPRDRECSPTLAFSTLVFTSHVLFEGQESATEKYLLLWP